MRRSYVLAAAALLLLGLALGFASAIEWRARIVWKKSTGELSDPSWSELIRWMTPGSAVDLRELAETADPDRSIRNPLTGDADAREGRRLFESRCTGCHDMGRQGEVSLEVLLSGSSDWAVFRNITRGIPGSPMEGHPMPDESVWTLVTYIRSLASLRTGAEPTIEASGAAVEPSRVSRERLMQAEFEPSNWLHFSGNYLGHRYSRLTQIDRKNVSRLSLEWAVRLSTREREVETTPIVVDGIMYITEPPSNVLALDAATGRVLWRYERPMPSRLPLCCGRVNRGVAVLDDRVYIGTLDAHLVALSARDGRVIWDVQVADPSAGYSITAAPLAVKDMIVTGVGGGDYGIQGLLDAYDARTGDRRWRFHTLPREGEPGHETWAAGSIETGGSATWMTGSFDPELDLLYWGVGNPAPVFQGDFRDGDNLFSNCVIALDPDDGSLEWYFQFTPHDEHDWDAAQTPVLVDAKIDGVERRLISWPNRNAFFYVLDRVNGTFLRADAFARHTWAERIDSRGRPVEVPSSAPSLEGTLVWPGSLGATNWWPVSYSPKTRLLYVPILEMPSIFFKGELPDFKPGEGHLGTADTPVGGQSHFTAVRALDPTSGEQRWEHRFPERRGWRKIGGTLTTAGDVVFVGDYTNFYALNAETGTELWRREDIGTINAAPMTFAVGDRQLVSISAGRAILTFGLGPPPP